MICFVIRDPMLTWEKITILLLAKLSCTQDGAAKFEKDVAS